jgi:phosphoribosylamine--glycine ligase
VPSPRFELCGTPEEAASFVDRAPFGFPMVIKADGLAQGKGTVVAEDKDAARKAVTALMTDKKLGTAGQKLVMEEFLAGEEASFLVFSDGSRVVPMASAQDHKRAKDDDKGPMTGGMGTVSPATNLSLDLHKQVMKDIVLPTISGLAAEGRRFQGVLFVGLMITEAGPKVLEFNARFGDPETQVILARMRSDIVPLLLQVAEGQLQDARIEWAKEPAVCVVLAGKGYPEGVETGQEIRGLDGLAKEADVVVYHAATGRKDGRLVTVGGRVLGVTALGANLQAAVARAYEAVSRISFDGMQYRRDIGKRALARLQSPR